MRANWQWIQENMGTRREAVGETREEGREGKVGKKEGSFCVSDTTTKGAGTPWRAV